MPAVTHEVTLARRCFKLDRPNAKAMIEGFKKGEKLLHQAIYCVVKEMQQPALITLQRSPTPFILSHVGESLDAENYDIPLRYVAVPVAHYYVKNSLDIWEILCHNGLFDIWDPNSPYKRFYDSKKPSSSFRIVLLRIYELEEEFSEDAVEPHGNRHDMLAGGEVDVTLKRPLVGDTEFQEITSLLEKSLGL